MPRSAGCVHVTLLSPTMLRDVLVGHMAGGFAVNDPSVNGGGKVGHVGGSIVGLWRWKTVPSAVFYKVDYQPVEGEMDVLSDGAMTVCRGYHCQ